MFDATRDLKEFYDNHVRLGADLRARLATARDLNLSRLNAGLQELGAEARRSYSGPIDTRVQGGYAMHTLNKSDEYDRDVALIFKKSDLPDDPLHARQRVRDALQRKATNFSKDPEARTNAVTVWYQDGYHIDFAIYRTWEESSWSGTVTHIEHASTTWKRRDPSVINDWFSSTVEAKSPSPNGPLLYAPPMAAPGQMRRIVRFVKRFCRSRTSFCLPGGMIASALVAETYVSDRDRDDVSLYRTLEALKKRLGYSTRVFNPKDPDIELTGKSEHHNEVKRMKKELDKHFPRLAVLNDPNCKSDQARSAWDWMFAHEYWQPTSKKYEDSLTKLVKNRMVDAGTSPYSVIISCKLTRGQGQVAYSDYASDGKPIPKGIGLRFSVGQTNCPGSYDVHWFIENEGDEAAEANQEKWDKYGFQCETSTKYRGRQKMSCRLEKGGSTVAQGEFFVNIR